ncbi:MAG: helix-turn-helix transcriptional regulator [Faecalicoccus sp.]|nr:helix-turn-helix transcriptional regulator [Faecalicoccus sp.]
MLEELFENRNLVAAKLKDCIRDKGYTKISFAEKAQISRPTLDKLLNGSINNKKTFDRHLQKILKTLDMSAKDLMLYAHTQNPKISAVYSKNAPAEHEMNDAALRQYNLLLDVVDLCTIYY